MPLTELFDETLDINATENYELSVEMSAHDLAFCIFDGIRNKFIMLRSFVPEDQKKFTPDQVRSIITKDDFLKKNYGKVHCVLSSSRFTLIPEALYDPGRKDEYFSFNHTISESSVIFTDRLKDPDSYLLFAFSKPYAEIIREFFPKSVPLHHLRPLFDQIHHERKNPGDNYIHAHIEADYFNLIIYSNNTLQLCNSFLYRNVSDILYYILNVFRNLNIKQEETIVLSGLAERFDDLSSNLSLYIRNIKYAGLTGNFTFSYVFNEIPLHRYITLFSAGSCES
ncbi:MAG: DUF3822 family protein [Bacteroidales bacterium]|jgi:hypothetical protein